MIKRTLLEDLVHLLDNRHNKDETLYVELQRAGIGKGNMILLYNERTGTGITPNLQKMKVEMNELLRFKTHQSKKELIKDILQGLEVLGKEGYKIAAYSSYSKAA